MNTLSIVDVESNRLSGKKKVLVCSLSNVDSDPRPNRIIRSLSKICSVSFMGFNSTIQNGSFYAVTTNRNLVKKILLLLSKIFRLHRWTAGLSYQVSSGVNLGNYDLLICHSPEFLPFLIRNKGAANLIFDAREFYPKQFESSISWKLLNAPFQNYLCKNYMNKIDHGITVSDGLAKEYKEQFQINLEVMYGLPPYVPLTVKKTEMNIKLIYHGIATPARELERVVLAMDCVKSGITLDLMLAGDSKYTKKIKDLARLRKNIRVIDPVPYDEIAIKLHQYDVGIVFFPPSTVNLMYCMPNKLFEIIQARLAIIVSPLKDVADFVTRENVGFIAESCETESLSKLINLLTPIQVDFFKNQSDRIAEQYSQQANDERLYKIVGKYLSQRDKN